MKGKVAIIDDSLTIRNIAKKYIREGGYEVVLISDFKDPISILKKEKPSLILLDIYLGEEKSDGHKICRMIREDRELSDIPVIMMSSVDEKFDIKEAFDSGSNIFIRKPFSKETILKEIERLIIKDKREEKILIIDDSSTSRKIAKHELERGGFTVIEAKSGEEGLEVLKREIVELIIVDIEMEGMDGFEFSRRIKEDPSFYSIPIIMLSSIDDPLIIKKAIESGIVEYFVKPFKHGELLNFVEDFLKPSNVSKEDKKILIVDDSKAQTSVLTHLLKRHGRKVLSFHDPSEALSYLRNNKDVSLIITDIYMPNMNGIELSKKAKLINNNVPIIGISATRSKKVVLDALSSGMDDFLYIPFFEEELNLRVNLQIMLYDKINSLNSLNKKLKELSSKDPLTSLFNRRTIFDLLEREFERSYRNNSVFSLIMFDIDHFKRVNDVYGHQKGDEILKSFAEILKESVRPYDTPSRIGGEEFLLLLPNTDKMSALKVGERIRKRVMENSVDGIKVTVSGGISSSEELSENQKISDLIKIADDRLYKAKESGRNQIILE